MSALTDSLIALLPIGGGIGDTVVPPVESVNPPESQKVPSGTLSSITDITNQIGNLFDAGFSVYESITGRKTANEQISGETVPPISTPIILQKKEGFYELYTANKSSVLLIGGGLVLLTMTLLIKKLR